jgi:hypothetical protein
MLSEVMARRQSLSVELAVLDLRHHPLALVVLILARWDFRA